MGQKFSFNAAVHLILFKENQSLLLRRFNTGWKDGFYSVVAGHIDGNETAVAALIRESKEEAGIDILEANVRFAHIMHRITDYGAEYMDFFFTTEKYTGEPQVMETDKCDDLRWFPVGQIPENTVPYIRQALEKIRANEHFSEFDERK